MLKGDLNITSNFVKKLAKITDMKIDIYYIAHVALFDRSKNMRITVAQNVNLSDLREILFKNNTIFKNSSQSKNKENVYFSFSQNQAYNIAFVDDILEIDTFKAKDHLCLVQTSKQKYQAYFLLDKYVSAEELYKIQKVLQSLYKGDVGALSSFQLKRLCGFINTKYNDHFIVKDVFWGNNQIHTDKILDYYHNVIEIKKQEIRKITNTTVIKEKSREKTWKDFAKNDDKSATDMSYVCYLVRKGYDDNEIEELLLRESENIENRKHNLHDYIERTIEKARNFLQIQS